MWLSGNIFQNSEFKWLQEFKERLLWTILSVKYISTVMNSEFFIVRVGIFTTCCWCVDIDIRYSLTYSFKNASWFYMCFLFMSYSLHMTFMRYFSYVRKINVWATKFACKKVFIVTASLQPWFIPFSPGHDSLNRVFLAMFISYYFFISSKKNKSTTSNFPTQSLCVRKVRKFFKSSIMMAMYSPKLFRSLPSSQSNMYCQENISTPEILLDMIMYSSCIHL